MITNEKIRKKIINPITKIIWNNIAKKTVKKEQKKNTIIPIKFHICLKRNLINFNISTFSLLVILK